MKIDSAAERRELSRKRRDVKIVAVNSGKSTRSAWKFRLKEAKISFVWSLISITEETQNTTQEKSKFMKLSSLLAQNSPRS